MKRIHLAVPAALLLASLVALPAAAQRMRHGHGPGGPDFARDLGLTEDQREQWRAAHEAHRDTIEPLVEQLHAQHDAVEAAIETGDATVVGEAVLAAHAIHDLLADERDRLEQAVLEILDEEQDKRYLEQREHRRHADGPGFGGHFRRRGPGSDDGQ